MMGIGFRQRWRRPTCFPMCAVTCAGAPQALCMCPERGAPGTAGVRGTPGALGALAHQACVSRSGPRGAWRAWRPRHA
eukprot:6559229-Pyramimonas_sp.AAC.1